MATETADAKTAHRRGMKVTAIATLGGVAAGIATPMVTSGPSDTLGLTVMLGAILLELGLMQATGVDVGEFSTKDHLYIVFMTFSLWFIVWTILLTTGVSVG